MSRLPKGARVLGATARLAEAGLSGGARSRGRDGQRWRCHSCGEVLAIWAGCERHARDAHRPGCRFECVIEVREEGRLPS